MIEKDPPPLTDASSGAPASLRALLEAGQRDVPNAFDIARVEAKLGALLEPGAAATAGAGSGVLAKVGLATLGGALLAAGVWFSMSAERPPAPGPKQLPAPSVEPSTPPLVAAPPSVEAPSGAPEALRSAESDPSAAAQNKAPKGAPASRAAALPEDAMLEQARRALGSDPRRALALTREHETTYPGGVLAQEREVIAIEALRRLGRADEAARRLERFERLFPQSAHRRKLERPSK